MPGQLVDIARAFGGVVRSPAYLRLWLAQLISHFGDTLHSIALVVLVFQFTEQGIAVAGSVAIDARAGADRR
jgi:hypothetical protein